MKLIIDISDEIVTDIKDYCGMSIADAKEALPIILNAIHNGTPLPKGHGRLIDADNAISKICGGSCGCHFEECGYDKPCFSVTRIKSAQTIIEADKAESEEKHDTDRWFWFTNSSSGKDY